MDKFLDGARTLLMQRGVHFTTAELAAYLGVSKRTIYERFTSKDALLDELTMQAFAGLRRREREIAEDGSLPVLERLRRIAGSNPEGFDLRDTPFIEDLRRYYPGIWTKVQTHIAEGRDLLGQLIRQGMNGGEIGSCDPEVVQQLIIGTLQHFTGLKYPLGAIGNLQEAINRAMAVIIDGIKSEKA